MSAIDVFLTEVRPWAPGVPDPVAFKAIRGAAIEFCERTRVWRFEDEYDATVDDMGEIFTPSGSVLHDIELVKWNDRELLAQTTRDLDTRVPNWRTAAASDQSGLPSYVTQLSLNSIRVVPAQDGRLYVCFRLKPDPNSMQLPDFLASEYKEIIGWGALGRLLTIPGQSYSNNDLAAYYSGLFKEKLDQLSTKGSTGQQNAQKRSKPRYF